MDPVGDYPLIETLRLRLRPFAPADAPDVRRLAGVREVAETTARIPHPYPEGAAEAWIATHGAEWTARRQLVLAITPRETGELAGAVGLSLQPEHESGELGYWLGVPYWGHGFATEAAAALVDFAFRRLALHRVQARHFARNRASGRVLLRAGLHREGASPEAMRKDGRFEDLVFYGLLRRQWQRAAGGR